nr:FG-GAP-like repeat-containing protein [uncultured Holophaga sp.]
MKRPRQASPTPFPHRPQPAWVGLLLTFLVAFLTACSSGQEPPPAISSFTSAKTILTTGGSTTLTASFTHGQGSIDQGIGTVKSGVAVSTGTLETSQSFTLTVTGSGSPATQTLQVEVVAAPVQPVITAPAHVLLNGTGYQASVPDQPGCTFAWKISGGSITAGADSQALTYTAGTSGYVVLTCTATNAAGAVSDAGMGISEIEEALAAPTITLPSAVTADTAGYTASVPLLGGYTYAWTISGGTLTGSDATQDSITFTAGSSGSVILTCTQTNSDGIPSLTSTATTPIVAAPEAPGITVASALWARTTASASITTPQSGCTYTWAITGGAFSSSSSGTSVTFIPYAKTPLTLTCQATNAAGGVSSLATAQVAVSFTQADVLSELGLDNPPARVGADGNTLTENDHPFGKSIGDVVTAQRIDEVLLIESLGAAVSPGPAAWALSKVDGTSLQSPTWDPLTVPDLIPDTTTNPYWIPVTADTNGDGKPEVIYLGLHDVMSSTATQTYVDVTRKTIGTTATEHLGQIAINSYQAYDTTDGTSYTDYHNMDCLRNLHQQISVGAGDIDGDGRDEIIFTCANTLYIFRVNSDSTVTLVASSALTDRTRQVLRVACADLDKDDQAEIVLVDGARDANSTAYVSVLKWDTSSSQLKSIVDTLGATFSGKTLRSAEVRIGDLDGDGTPEIVLSGLLSDKSQLCTTLLHVTYSYSTKTWTSAFVDGAYLTEDLQSQVWKWPGNTNDTGQDWTNRRDWDHAAPALALGDVKGDGTTQVATCQSLLTYDGTTLAFMAQNLFVWTGRDMYATGQPYTWLGISQGASEITNRTSQTWYGQMVAGRFTQDPNGGDEILVLDQSRNYVRRFYYDSTAAAMAEGDTIPVWTSNSDYRVEYLLAADINTDQTQMKYLGVATLFSRPLIIAVLASPPYWGVMKADGSDYIQQTGNSYTQFGMSVGSSVGASVKFGVAYSVSLGAKAEIPVISNGEFESKTTVKYSANFSVDVDAAYERNISYDTYAGTDAVLFSSVPVDCYRYQVTKVGAGSKLKEGEIVVVQKTRKSVLQFTDVAFYNEHNGDYPDVDGTVLQHTIGNPLSYMGYTQALAKTLDPTQLLVIENVGAGIVPRGNLYNTMNYATSVTAATSAEFTWETESESQASFAILVGASASTSLGIAIRTSTTLGTSIGGSVGGLDPDYYTSSLLYNWGVVTYVDAIGNGKYPISYTDSSGNTAYNFPFKVVTYWVSQ